MKDSAPDVHDWSAGIPDMENTALALEQRRSLALGAFLQGQVGLTDASRMAVMNEADFRALAGDVARTASQRLEPTITTTPRLSVVVPVLNEEANLEVLYHRMIPVLETIGTYELIIVDDGSHDRSAAIVRELHRSNPAVKLVSFSRNFGHQAALTAGIDHATGDAVVLIDADLQDPPEVLTDLVAQWEQGFEVVYAVRRKRKESLAKRSAYAMFYRVLRSVADIDIPLDTGDFCLMDRRVIDALRELPERTRFLRGLRSWVGFRQVGVEYERAARNAGPPKYTFRRLVKLAVDGMLGFSAAPLRMASLLGFLTSAAGVIYLAIAVLARFTIGHVPSGWTSLVAVTLTLGGTQLLVTGVLGEYIARIYDETKGRPPYVVRDRHGWGGRRRG